MESDRVIKIREQVEDIGVVWEEWAYNVSIEGKGPKAVFRTTDGNLNLGDKVEGYPGRPTVIVGNRVRVYDEINLAEGLDYERLHMTLSSIPVTGKLLADLIILMSRLYQ